MNWYELFSVASTAGMQPKEVLDCTWWEISAVIEGYQNHLIDLRCIGVEQGYYSAYYANKKRPKPVYKIVNELLRSKVRKSSKKSASAPNIAAYKALEQTFKEVKLNAK